MPIAPLPSGYDFFQGSGLDQASLVKFMQRTYAELEPTGNYSHLAATVEQYFSQETPLWWVQLNPEVNHQQRSNFLTHPVACLWMGTAIDQLTGDRQSHIFLLYVMPSHRRQGIGTALMHHAEQWARSRGDRTIGLQVFHSNQTALTLYQRLGYEVHSIGMTKSLRTNETSL